MTLAFAFAIAGWEGGTDFVLHSQFPVVVNAIGYCGPFFGVIGGGVATMSFVRAISDWPLGGSDKIANYFALAVGVVMSLWTLARFMR